MIQSFEMFNENVKFVKQPVKKGAKTNIYNVTKDGNIIGLIKWSSRARGYAFLPTTDCSTEITNFVKDLMQKHRALRKKEKAKLNETWKNQWEDDVEKSSDPWHDIEKLKKEHPNQNLDFEKIIQLRKLYSEYSSKYQQLLNAYENDPRRNSDGSWNTESLEEYYYTKFNEYEEITRNALRDLELEINPILKSEKLKKAIEIGIDEKLIK